MVPAPRVFLRLTGLYLGITGVSAAALLLQFWPYWPLSWQGWTVFLLAALPVTLIGEYFGERLLQNRVSAAVERRTAASTFSWLRIGYLLLLMLLICALGILISAL